MRDFSDEQIAKRFNEMIDSLDNLQRLTEDAYKREREAKAFTKAGFRRSEARLAKEIEIRQKLIDNEQVFSEKEIQQIVKQESKGIGRKEALGLTQGDKIMGKHGIGNMASMASQGLMHAAGVATGNPLFNLLASNLGARRNRIADARKSVYEQEQAQQDEQDDYGSDEVQEAAQKLLQNPEPTNEMENSVVDSLVETSAMMVGSKEHLQAIMDNTELSNEYLDEILDAMSESNDALEESNEDKRLTNDDVSGAVKANPAKNMLEGFVPPKDDEENSNLIDKFGDIGQIVTGISSLKSLFGPNGTLLTGLAPFAKALGAIGGGVAIAMIAKEYFPKLDNFLKQRELNFDDQKLVDQYSMLNQSWQTDNITPQDVERMEDLKKEIDRRGIVLEGEKKHQGWFGTGAEITDYNIDKEATAKRQAEISAASGTITAATSLGPAVTPEKRKTEVELPRTLKEVTKSADRITKTEKKSLETTNRDNITRNTTNAYQNSASAQQARVDAKNATTNNQILINAASGRGQAPAAPAPKQTNPISTSDGGNFGNALWGAYR